MHNNSQIETFINSLNFNWQDLIEFLPIGILFFDDKWKITSANTNFSEIFEIGPNYNRLEGSNLFSMHVLYEKLPYLEISKLKEGKHFEKIIRFTQLNNKEKNVVIKGSPIFKDNVFHGGILTVEDYDFSYSESSDITNEQNPMFRLFKNIFKCFLIVDLNDNITYLYSDPNSKCAEIKNWNHRKISEIFSTESETSLIKVINSAAINEKPEFIELVYYSDKEKIILNSVFIPIYSHDQKIEAVILLVREKSEADVDVVSFLSNSRILKEYESFATIETDGLFKINLYGNIVYWTKNAERLFGITENGINLKFMGELFPEITKEKFEVIRKKILDNGFWEGFLVNKDDLDENVIKVKIISKIENNVTDLFVYCKKIDKQQQQLISAREEEKLFFKDTVMKSTQMILQTNPNGTILFANERFCNEFEYELDEIRGKYLTDLINIEYKKSNKLNDFEQFLGKDENEVVPLVTKSNRIIEVCVNVNISTYKTELKYFTIYFKNCSSEDKLFLEVAHSLLYQFPFPVVIVKKDKIVKVNPKFYESLGSEFESDYFNLPLSEIIVPKFISDINEVLHENILNEKSRKVILYNKDKKEITAEVKRLCCSRDSSSSVLSFRLIDQIEENEESEIDKVKKEMGKIGPYYWRGKYKDEELIISIIDEEFSKITGYSLENFIDKPNFFREITHPDDVHKLFDHFKNVDKTSDDIKEITYRVFNIEGDIVWIKNRLKIKVDSNGDLEIFGALSNVTDWTLEREELRSIITELDRLNTAKEKFISIISHDLKSPFTSIVGFSELILTDSSLSKDEILDYVSHIKDASLHTVDLLNGLLDLTKLQTGRIEVEAKIINANYIAKKSVEILSGLAFQKGLKLSYHVDKSFYITADNNLIFQVFNNLVANSIKFTPRGGSIEIFARELPEVRKIEFTIKDSGVGIEKEDQSKLFVIDKKFTTLGTDGERGTGLGLSLVKEIIDKHGGEIEVKSEVNKGTEFIFTLPISSPSILILDTNLAERVVYSKIVESITDNIEIIQAGRESEAIKIVKEKMPMLIIFEHQLVKMNGNEFIGELKKAGLVYEPALMILTKYYSEELKNSYLDIGVDYVFRKPFELNKFKVQLDKLIGKVD